MFAFCSTVTKLPFINKLRRGLIDLASRFRGFSLCGMECMAKQTRLCHVKHNAWKGGISTLRWLSTFPLFIQSVPSKDGATQIQSMSSLFP